MRSDRQVREPDRSDPAVAVFIGVAMAVLLAVHWLARMSWVELVGIATAVAAVLLAWWAVRPQRRLPRNRVRHMRLRLHPGEHLIYRTPPGWTGRAWVGKDPANPVPPGVDLRMPGQILMAAPSVVPGPDGPARYGPITGNRVADLPARYVTAWTPPQPQPRLAVSRTPVPPEGADRAARYVHNAMTRIAEDLASRQPGGRNAAAYAAGLKAGSLLGAARATPGAEQAAAAWTDEAAEEALLDAAERNGYTGKDGQAEARRAIRSGLGNGLRNPRALPDFTTDGHPAAVQRQPPRQPAPSGPARPQRSRAAVAPRRRAGRWQDMVPDDIRRQIEAADQAARDRRRAAIAAHQQALERHSQSPTSGTAADLARTSAAADAAHRPSTSSRRPSV